jgi:hypothetical protein
MIPFQATVLLLTIAAVGSVALASYDGRRFGTDDVAHEVPTSEQGAELPAEAVDPNAGGEQ